MKNVKPCKRNIFWTRKINNYNMTVFNKDFFEGILSISVIATIFDITVEKQKLNDIFQM